MVDPDGSPMADRRGRCLPSRNVSTAVTAGFKCHRCETEASNPLDAIRSPRDTPIWKLEAVGLPVTGMVRSVKEVKVQHSDALDRLCRIYAEYCGLNRFSPSARI